MYLDELNERFSEAVGEIKTIYLMRGNTDL
jgi:hypothetical protein